MTASRCFGTYQNSQKSESGRSPQREARPDCIWGAGHGADGCRRRGRRQPENAQRRPREWTTKKERAFFSALAETCNVRLAAEAAAISPSSAYRRRRSHAAFRAGWAEALGAAYQRLELVLLERALKGPRRWCGARTAPKNECGNIPTRRQWRCFGCTATGRRKLSRSRARERRRSYVNASCKSWSGCASGSRPKNSSSELRSYSSSYEAACQSATGAQAAHHRRHDSCRCLGFRCGIRELGSQSAATASDRWLADVADAGRARAREDPDRRRMGREGCAEPAWSTDRAGRSHHRRGAAGDGGGGQRCSKHRQAPAAQGEVGAEPGAADMAERERGAAVLRRQSRWLSRAGT